MAIKKATVLARRMNYSAFAEDGEINQKMLEEAVVSGARLACGWIPRDDMTTEQKRNHDAFQDDMPKFTLRGRFQADERRVALWKATAGILGKPVPFTWQQTGSCVGAGGDNMTKVQQGVEIVLQGDNEKYEQVWWLAAYARSRLKAGLGGQGEGSFGSAWAWVAQNEGTSPQDPEGVDTPDFKVQNGWLVQPAAVEMAWSDGKKVPTAMMEASKKHLFRTVSPLKSADDVYEAIVGAKCAVTIASMFGMRSMVPPLFGSKHPVRIGSWDGEWAHQMSINEVWDHPEVNDTLFWIQNNWGPNAHGTPPTAECAGGGFYVRKSTLEQVLRERYTECYAYGKYDGFFARNYAAF
jgi:hypothetical protein